MDMEIQKKFDEQAELIKQVYASAEKTRKYILWSIIAAALMIILPLIGLMFVIPTYLKTLDLTNLGL